MLVIGACASAGPAVEGRAFERPGLADVSLQRLAVAVVAAGPPRIADTTFAVRGFAPPQRGEPLLLGTEDPETRDALAFALDGHLRRAGYDVELHSSVHGRSSTTATTAVGRRLEVSTTLDQILGATEADAVLIVRVVPVDEFHLDFGTGTRVETTALGRERIKDFRPVKHQGRLLVGQAFLFDRRTGLRLWTRQAPDYPEVGRLTPKHPFLRYGYVHRDKEAALPDTPVLAERATAAFVKRAFGEFPAPQQGTTAGRDALEAVDVALESSIQRFRDDTHVAIEVSGRWGMEPAQLEINLAEELELDPLDTGAVAPGGLPRVAPQLSILTQSGLVWSFGVPITIAPANFERVIHLDDPTGDRTAVLSVKSLFGFGAELQLGGSFHLAETIMLVPRGGLFADIWLIEAAPSSVLVNTTRARVGALAGLDLILRAAADSLLYGRLGVDGRLGADLEGALLYGFQLSLGVGLLL